MKTQIEEPVQQIEEATINKEEFVNLEKYFKKRLKKIIGFLKRDNEALVQETIHELRVEIKKIDALFDLTKSIEKKFSRQKHFRPFLKVFKQAGKLRSIQVEFNLINSHFSENTNSNYLHQLHEIKHQRRIAFENILHSNLLHQLELSKKQVIPFIRKIRRKDIVYYFNTRERKMIKFLDKKLFKEKNLHIVRTSLKRFYLNIKNITPYKIESGWTNIINLMGEWHDRQVAFDQLLKAIYSSKLTNHEIDRLHKVKSELLIEKDNLYEQIVAA
ncbi:MAG TPA: hypothetical protein VFW11_04370, partial [Cyclobacteriaceae bacterium]|nr:hypothetical protein [Cyclobacteriaceae bacterium]